MNETNSQLALELARRQGVDAMNACAEKADRTNPPDWGSLAYAFLVRFAMTKTKAETFTAEDVTDAFANDLNFVQPHDKRAWGAVFTRAKRKDVIEEKNRSARRRNGHGCKGGAVYRSLMRGRAVAEVL